MDTNLLLWAAGGWLLSKAGDMFFGRSGALENEVKTMGQNFARLEQKLENWIDRVSTAQTAAPQTSASPMSALLDGLLLLERLKGLGIVKITAA